jgi:hypothetical protein
MVNAGGFLLNSINTVMSAHLIKDKPIAERFMQKSFADWPEINEINTDFVFNYSYKSTQPTL